MVDAMRGLFVPESDQDFTADPVELFFDLTYVFAFSQIVHMLVVHPDWEHIGKAVLVFLLLWVPWTQLSWSANAIPGNQRSVRLSFLVATVASVPMAAAVDSAFGEGGPLFAFPLAVIHVTALALVLIGLPSGSNEFRSALTYFGPNLVAMVVLIVGAFTEGNSRVALWIISLLIVTAATVRAGHGDWVMRPGHFAERHGLIIIIALGEVIVALGNAVVGQFTDDGGFSASVVLALIAAGVAAGILWWAYFDRFGRAIEYHADEVSGHERVLFARNAYTYAHAPIVLGVILMAVGLEEAGLHPTEPMPAAFGWILWGGLAAFIGGQSIAFYLGFKAVPIERIVSLFVLGAVIVLADDLNAVWLLVVLDVLSIVALAIEHYRVEFRFRHELTDAPAVDPA